jgi:hypothetical protein
MSLDVLARIETGRLNKPMGTTGRAENIGSSGDTVLSRITFLCGIFNGAISCLS